MIVNCTKQDINVMIKGGLIVTLKSSGDCPWIEVERDHSKDVDLGNGYSVPLFQEKLIKVKNIPKKKKGVFYIVSAKVADYFPERDDFIMPNLLRDSLGNPIGITSFRLTKQRKKI